MLKWTSNFVNDFNVSKNKKAHSSIYLSLKVMNHSSKILFFGFYNLTVELTVLLEYFDYKCMFF